LKGRKKFYLKLSETRNMFPEKVLPLPEKEEKGEGNGPRQHLEKEDLGEQAKNPCNLSLPKCKKRESLLTGGKKNFTQGRKGEGGIYVC